jgi:hypothetical protein
MDRCKLNSTLGSLDKPIDLFVDTRELEQSESSDRPGRPKPRVLSPIPFVTATSRPPSRRRVLGTKTPPVWIVGVLIWSPTPLF